MAELYENPKHYVTAGGAVGDSANGEPTVERMLAELPPEEREEAMQYITAPPSGEEIMRAMQEKNSRGEVMNMTLDQYRLFKAHNKNKETDVIAGIGEAAGVVFDEIQKAAGSIVDNPADAAKKLTPSVVEAFAQGTRNLYGMAAQSADPNSVFFRMKNALQANGDDEEAELQQFMEAQAFNVHSMRLMTGQDTIIMDKDVINPEMTQVMSYIADPTLFVPFGGLAAKGASMVGMGEKLAMAGARTQAIRNLVLGGAIKWGVGAPLEFMGGAIRNTIDFGIETGSRAIETATGVAAKDIQSAARVGAIGTTAGSAVGLEVNSSLSSASRYYTGSLIARNVGEAASIYGEQMMKQGKIGRGVLGYAGQAIRDTERAGIKLTPQTKSLLKAIEAVDPLFVYADDIAQGAAQGAIIGGGLGYLAGGEEGFAGGVGSGMALGGIGATAGKVIADVTGNTKIDQMAIQRKLIIEALKENGNENAVGFEAMAAMAQATGDRAFQGYIDGIIAGIDTVNPDAVFKAFNKVQYETHLKAKGIDPNTGVLLEKSRIFPELNDRTVKADVLGVLRDTGNRFAGDPAGFEQAIKNAPEFAKLKPVWSRLDDNAKAVILKQIKDNGDPAFVKGLKGRQLNAHWGDLAYSERLADMINSLNQKNSNSVPDKIRDTLKAETRSDKKLTRRGQMLKEKLQADGYIDKDGNIRQRRLTDVEGTQGEFEASAGWAKSRDSTGRTEVVINLDKWAMDSGNRLSLAHELYHSIMLDSVFAPDYIDRLSQKLLGKFDPKTGRVLEQALVAPDELMKFFSKYIENDPSNRGDAETIKRKKEELKKSIDDYRTRGTANRVADATAIPLEHLVEEFGAYYFSKWVKAQPIDYMFRGGEFGGIRGLMEMASDGWLDYWKGKVGEKNPNFNFDAMGERGVSKAFERDGKRVSSRSLDLFMRDIVRIEARRNSNNGFDVNKLSKESREWFIKVNGLRGAEFGTIDKQGNLRKPKLRRYTAEEIRQGKEMFKVLESLPDAAHKDGMRRDGNGNWSGKPNTAQINALVGAGYIQRAWFDRMMRAYDIVEGNGSNIIEFGYLGYSAHIGDGDARVYGAAVPFKNRRAVLIGVDFKVRADGTVFSNLHTLDLKVIEARGNEIWKDPQTRELWKGSRTDMEADFYAYLSNASLPSDHPNRKPSGRLLDKGDGLGGQRRDALHQMLGFHKNSDLPYINRPIAEIPVGIRHSVTTFSNDGIVNMRVDNKPRYDFNFENAHLDLSRNFMPDEMRQETTPSGGKIIKHATGYQISKQAGAKFKVFDPEGKHLGDFDTIADAGRAAQKHFNDAHEAKTEGVDPAVPRTEIPPSRVEYLARAEVEAMKTLFEDDNVRTIIIDELAFESGRIEKEAKWSEADKIKYIEIAEKMKAALEARDYSSDDFKKGYYYLLTKPATSLPKMDFSSMGKDHFFNHFIKVHDLIKKRVANEYDAMYPMEIKSALHGQLAQIFQDHPNITAQGLLKKLVTYGSRGNRFFQEATEIGLVKLLKSKVKPTKDIYRKFDAQGNPTGEVVEREIPVQWRKVSAPVKDAEGNIVKDKDGNPVMELRETSENLSGTQEKLDMQEILDYAKEKEIKVTIEEGAKEVTGLVTSRLTLGGTKFNYKETAIRINPEYAHGIRGHYGDDTIVHFRTTERIDVDGNRHLFIEEVQANNTDLTTAVSVTAEDVTRAEEVLTSRQELRNKAVADGIFILDPDGDGSTYVNAREKLINSGEIAQEINPIIRELVSNEIPTKGFDAAMDRDKLRTQVLADVEEVLLTTRHTVFEDIIDSLAERFEGGYGVYNEEKAWNIWTNLKGRKELHDAVMKVSKIANKEMRFRIDNSSLLMTADIGFGNAIDPTRMNAELADAYTTLNQLRSGLGSKEKTPMVSKKDTALTALKGAIRQGIRDGLDRITLTHPDDSPRVSNMNVESARADYGKIIPELWASWLKKYGIEIKQTNKLPNATLESAKNSLALLGNRVHDSVKETMSRFQEVMSGEDYESIKHISSFIEQPVHEFAKLKELREGKEMTELLQYIEGNVNDVVLKNKLLDVVSSKTEEARQYNIVTGLQEKTITQLHGLDKRGLSTDNAVNARISAEAIDRGYTFILNDRIKREFLEGRINTHSMPAEDIYSGGRVYDQNSKQFKSGFVGLYAAENPDRVKGISLQFMKRADGSHRIRLTDNSKKGESADIGHITANIEGDRATLSSHINEAYRGKKLAYVVYSEMAERLRAMGVTAVDGQIVNPDGIPIKVRERIIGDTRDLYSGRRINYVEGANRIRDKQEIVGSMGGVDVTNTLYKQARYQPAEGNDYRGTHKAPSGEDGAGSLDAMDRTYPEDLYSAQGARYYGSGDKTDKRMHELIMKLRGKPDAMVTVYRAVPKGVDASIAKGDWVTPLREYAVLHGNRWEQGMTILEKKVKASELFTEGNSIYEFGWSPKEITKADALRKEIADHEKFMERSRNNAPILWERKGTKIYAQREAMERRLSSLKYELKNIEQEENRPKFQPAEGEQGGRTYKDSQLEGKFIGKYAQENPSITKDLTIEYYSNDTSDFKDVDGTKWRVVLKDKNGFDIGDIAFEYEERGRFFNGTEDVDGLVVRDISVHIGDPANRGKNYQHLLYSEMFERARAIGAIGFSQNIENKIGIPLKSINRIAGKDSSKIWTLRDYEPVSTTQENFDRLMANAPKMRSGKGLHSEFVQNNGKLDPNVWYQPSEKVGTQSSNVKLLLEGMRSGRILRTSSYKGLGLEDSLLIAHTPDTAKIGQVTAGDKALADLQGGIFYAIANGKKIWASNFAGEGETNILVNFAKDQLQQNANGKTYIMLVKADNSKIFASVDGARGVSNIFKHLNDSGVMSDLRYSRALKNSAEMHLKIKGLDGLGKDELYARIDDALLRSKENKISFENRAEFTREIARQLNEAGAFDSKNSKDALVKSFHKGFERGFSIVEMERVFGNLMAEDIIKDVPKGHVYGAIEITSPLKESPSSNHRGYDASIEQKSGEPAKLIMFDRTAHVTEIVNKKSGEEISMFKAGEGAYHSYTGGQIPYQEVRGKKQMPFQPAEFTEFKSEQSATGRILRNAKDYVIMLANNKFRVYNPAKAIIGVYGSEEEAKKRIYKEIPKQ